MLIQDLRFIEETSSTEHIYGGVAVITGVSVSAKGSKGSSSAYSMAFGENTGAKTVVGTRSAKGDYYELSAATGGATAYSVTVGGKNSRYEVAFSTGYDTDIKI